MSRGEVILSSILLSLAACGGGGSTPDAELIHEADASPPDASRPDAFVCTLTECGTDCVDLTSDPLNCGDCLHECQSGASCIASNCECPPNFLPATVSPSGLDQIITQLPGAYIAVGPMLDAVINGFGVGYPTTDPVLNTPIDLSTIVLPATPFAIALYDIDIATMLPAGAFAATAGILTFTSACSVGATGTLTNATFQAATVFPSPMVDPLGCTFTVPSITFAIGTACP